MTASLVVVNPINPDEATLREAARCLAKGQLVAFPTETVYGLGANGLDAEAVEKIYLAKGRPSDNPLILHFGCASAVASVALVDSRARRLMERFWPGPLTLVLPAKDCVPLATRGGLDTVACRMPSHPVALALLKLCDFPVAAPSANLSGRPSPTDADAVFRDLGPSLAMIIDGGATAVGLESTVLDVTDDVPVLLRPGGVSVEELEEEVGAVNVAAGEGTKKRSPGTRYRHYAPQVPLIIWRNEKAFNWPEDFVYLGMMMPEGQPRASVVFDDVASYAQGYFAALRQLECHDLPIVAQWPPQQGIGRALQDRLKRSAGEK